MATFIPSKTDDYHGSFGEEVILSCLRTLPDEYIVFHSLEWIDGPSKNGHRVAQGEADFTIFHPDKGIAIVEVKGGAISCDGREWVQTNIYGQARSRKMQDPVQQADRSKFKIKEIIDNYGIKCLTCHGVWFPDVDQIEGTLPLNYHSNIVLLKKDLGNPQGAIDRIFAYWSKLYRFSPKLSPLAARRVVDTLAPVFKAVPSMQSIFDERERLFVRLTNEQTAILDYLDEQRLALIHGRAGTGKTLLAVEKARRLAETGDKVLFLCYNAALRQHLRNQYSIPNVEYDNLHTLPIKLFDEADGLYGDSLIELLVRELTQKKYKARELWPYNHLIIDEGQDFPDEVVQALLGVNSGHVYIFYDRYQLVHLKDVPKWTEQIDCRLVLNRNCRSTVQITRSACSVIGEKPNITLNNIQGDEPQIIFSSELHKATELIVKIIKQAVRKGIELRDIAVLSLQPEGKSLFTAQSFRSIPVTEKYGEPGLLFTTVRKFKGLEAKVLILTDVSAQTFKTPQNKRLYYVGASRAKHELYVFINPGIKPKEIVEKLAQDEKVPPNHRGISRLLHAKSRTEIDFEE